MIRVNLLKTRVPSSENTVGQGTMVDNPFLEDGGGGGLGNPVINFLIIVLLPGALVVYEFMNLSELEDKYLGVQTQVQQVQGQINSKRAAADKAKARQQEIQVLEKKIEILKSLTKSRMLELKALDFLQSVIPERVWLSNIDYANRKFVFKGFAVADEDLTDFMRRLESRSYYTNVILVQATEAKSDQGTVRSFEISSELKVEN